MNSIAKPSDCCKIEQQVQYLRLDRDVEGGDGFVGDDEDRLDGQGTGDTDALTLAAGEFVRVALHCVARQADAMKAFDDAIGPIARRADVMDAVGFLDDVAHFQARIEAGVGVLKDHLHAPAEGTQRRLTEVGDVLALEADFSVGGFDQTQDGAAGGGLAAAGFTDQSDDFAGLDCDAEPVHRAQRERTVAEDAAPGGETDTQLH